jgi:hypothetical protein
MTWRILTEELDAWAAAGRAATLWWRDDDAVAPSAELERLLGLAAARDVPIALAAIPARASEALARGIETAGARVTLLQHGYAHRNHAPAAEKKAELGAHRPANAVLEELARGQARMSALFGSALFGSGPFGLGWAPVLVPPWNRIAEGLVPEVGRLGFRGLSTYGARAAAEPAPGLVQINSHVDIMRWDAPRGFLGAAEALDLLAGHLRARRLGEADEAEPSGLLSHHGAHDEACWAFLDELLGRLAEHPAARFVAAGEAFAAEPSAARTPSAPRTPTAPRTQGAA